MNDMTPDPRDRPLEYLPADAVLWPSPPTDGRVTDAELDDLFRFYESACDEEVLLVIAEVKERRAADPEPPALTWTERITVDVARGFSGGYLVPRLLAIIDRITAR